MQKKYMRCFYQNRSLSLKYCQITQVSHWEHMHVKNKYKKCLKCFHSALALSSGHRRLDVRWWVVEPYLHFHPLTINVSSPPTIHSASWTKVLSSPLSSSSSSTTVVVKYGLALDPLFPFFQVFCTCNFLFVLLQLLYSLQSGLLEGSDNFR